MSRHLRLMPVSPRKLPESLGDAFSTAEALEAGTTSGRLRAKDLERPFHGARLRAEPDEPPPRSPPSEHEIARRSEVRKARAYRTVMGAHAFFAGRTAGVLHGGAVDPGHAWWSRSLRPTAHREERASMGSKCRPGSFAWANSMTCGSRHRHRPGRCSARNSRCASSSRSATRLFACRGTSEGCCSPASACARSSQLEGAVGAGRRVGIEKLRSALPLIRVGSASPLETDFRLDAAEGGLPEPELDVEIRDGHDRLLGISEVVYPRWRTVVEIEGDHHRTDRGQWNRDIEKYASYVAEGWEVVRLTFAHIRGGRAVGMVRSVLLRRGWNPG